MTEVEAVDAFVKFLYNESPHKIYMLVYGRNSVGGSYAAEKIREMQRDPLRWWGSLDSEHQQRLMDAAIQRSR